MRQRKRECVVWQSSLIMIQAAEKPLIMIQVSGSRCRRVGENAGRCLRPGRRWWRSPPSSLTVSFRIFRAVLDFARSTAASREEKGCMFSQFSCGLKETEITAIFAYGKKGKGCSQEGSGEGCGGALSLGKD